ncbi:hypothetical protein KW787_02310 [Candidatus Pacearchaeota archaeon]|nr:hypothetical protein [Candidatus Pacearchaeota archaeon]
MNIKRIKIPVEEIEKMAKVSHDRKYRKYGEHLVLEEEAESIRLGESDRLSVAYRESLPPAHDQNYTAREYVWYREITSRETLKRIKERIRP